MKKKYDKSTFKECTFLPKTNLRKSGAEHRRHHTLGAGKVSTDENVKLRKEDELAMPFERSEGGKTPNDEQPGAMLRTGGATKSMHDLAISQGDISGLDKTPKRMSGAPDTPNVFDYLSSGRLHRQERLKALQDQKEQEEKAVCTFKPSTNLKRSAYSSAGPERWNKLHQKIKDEKKLSETKKQKELRECTFKPNLDKKSLKMMSKNRDSTDSKGFDSLHAKHKARIEKYEKLQKEKQDAELVGCTFQPTIEPSKMFRKKSSTASKIDLKFKNHNVPSNQNERNKSIAKVAADKRK